MSICKITYLSHVFAANTTMAISYRNKISNKQWKQYEENPHRYEDYRRYAHTFRFLLSEGFCRIIRVVPYSHSLSYRPEFFCHLLLVLYVRPLTRYSIMGSMTPPPLKMCSTIRPVILSVHRTAFLLRKTQIKIPIAKISKPIPPTVNISIIAILISDNFPYHPLCCRV